MPYILGTIFGLVIGAIIFYFSLKKRSDNVFTIVSDGEREDVMEEDQVTDDATIQHFIVPKRKAPPKPRGKIETKSLNVLSIDLSAITSIESDAVDNVFLTPTSLEVDENHVVFVKNRILKIKSKPSNNSCQGSITINGVTHIGGGSDPNPPKKQQFSLVNYNEYNMAKVKHVGVGNFTVVGFHSVNILAFKSGGVGNMKLVDCKITDMQIDNSGVGNTTIDSGCSMRSLTLNNTGVGNINVRTTDYQTVLQTNSGVGSISLSN